MVWYGSNNKNGKSSTEMNTFLDDQWFGQWATVGECMNDMVLTIVIVLESIWRSRNEALGRELIIMLSWNWRDYCRSMKKPAIDTGYVRRVDKD